MDCAYEIRGLMKVLTQLNLTRKLLFVDPHLWSNVRLAEEGDAPNIDVTSPHNDALAPMCPMGDFWHVQAFLGYLWGRPMPAQQVYLDLQQQYR